MFIKFYSLFGTDIKVESDSEKALKLVDKSIGFFATSKTASDKAITIKILFPPHSLLNEKINITEGEECLFTFDKLKGFRIAKTLFVTDGVSIAECCGEKGAIDMFLDEKVLLEERFFSFVFFYLILMEMLRYFGFYYVHSSCISVNGKALIIPGDTGAGKTTLCITLLREGFNYLSDDGVLLKKEDDKVKVLALPGEFHIDPLISERFSELKPVYRGEKYGEGPKRAFGASDIYPGQFVSEALQKYIIYPEIADCEKSVLQKLSRAEAFARFIPHSLLVMMDRDIAPLHLETLKRTVEVSQSYRLKSGRDLLDNPAKVVSMINRNLFRKD